MRLRAQSLVRDRLDELDRVREIVVDRPFGRLEVNPADLGNRCGRIQLAVSNGFQRNEADRFVGFRHGEGLAKERR
jgi:hypothetical protein